MHWQHPVTGRHARCQFMVDVGSRAPMITVFEGTRERSTRNNQTSECKGSLLKDWFVHRGRPRLIRMGPDGCYISTHFITILESTPRSFLERHRGNCRSRVSLSERESLSIDRDKGDKEKARTFTDIVQDFRFSKGAHVDLRSQHDPPDGIEPRHLGGKIFVRTRTEMPGPSSSGMRTETRPVVEPTVIPSATNLENQMPATHDSSEPTPVPGTDETQDRESPDINR